MKGTEDCDWVLKCTEAVSEYLKEVKATSTEHIRPWSVLDSTNEGCEWLLEGTESCE